MTEGYHVIRRGPDHFMIQLASGVFVEVRTAFDEVNLNNFMDICPLSDLKDLGKALIEIADEMIL